MFDLDAALAARCEDGAGIVTNDDCDGLGIDRYARWRRTRGGLLVVEHPGVYRHAAVARTFETELMAAIRAAGEFAAASGPSAMRLFDVRGEWDDTPEVTVLGTEHLVLEGVNLRRIDRLEPFDIHHRKGIPVLAPALALLLLGASVPPWKVESAVHDMVFQRFTTRARLIDMLRRYGGRGRRGSTALRAAVRSLDPTGRATQTNLELHLLRPVRGAGVPEPELQFPVVDANGTKRKLDIAWPSAMLDVETDGDRDHLHPSAKAADRRRDAALRRVGWEVLRFSSDEVELRPTWCVNEIIRSLARTLR